MLETNLESSLDDSQDGADTDIFAKISEDVDFLTIRRNKENKVCLEVSHYFGQKSKAVSLTKPVGELFGKAS